MLGTICAIVIASHELVCSKPVRADLADILVQGDSIHLFASGGQMFDTHSQPTSHIFVVHEGDAMWPRALAASEPKSAT